MTFGLGGRADSVDVWLLGFSGVVVSLLGDSMRGEVDIPFYPNPDMAVSTGDLPNVWQR